MTIKRKYSFEFKLKVVKAYLNKEGGYVYLAKKYNIPSHTRIVYWVASYERFGEESLEGKIKKRKYTLDFKVEVVEYYLTRKISYKDLSMKLGINNPTLIVNWVSIYRKEGIEGLSKTKGRLPKMKSKNERKGIINNNKKTNINVYDRIKELEEKVTSLEIENAYLKELRRLRNTKALIKKIQQESSTISEKDIN